VLRCHVGSLDDAIRDALRSVAGIALVAVFGSRARGDERPDSDLDVAILPSEPATRPRWRLLGEVASALVHLSGGRVDVVFLDEAPELLRQRIMEHGRLVTCDDPATWALWRIRTMREHGDREWARRVLAHGRRLRNTEGTEDGRRGRALESLERTRRLPR